MNPERFRAGSSMALILTVALTTGLGAASDVADAVMRGDAAAVRALLSQKADVNAPQADGTTALHWAVYRGDPTLADLLIRAGADHRIASRDGVTPLSLASSSGDAALVGALLKAGADPNEALPTGKTNLMLAARAGNPDAVKALLDAGADVNAKESLRGTTALMWAAAQARPDAVKLLVERGADLRARSNPAPPSRGARLGKSGDPRKAVAAQGAARAAGQALDLDQLGGARGASRAVGAATTAPSAVTSPPAAASPTPPTAPAPATPRTEPDEPEPATTGELTALVYAVRSNDVESVRILLDAGADVNQVTGYGWSPLLVATQNRYYKLASFLIDRGADLNLTNKGGWTPLYLATDNRNIESGDYPVRKADIDHLEFIKLLLDKGAEVNARVKDSTETRTVFTDQWLDENGATAFLRASQSGDVALMRLLLAYGADPKINTVLNVTPLQVAAGIGWVEGITFEWSEAASVEAVKLLLDLGVDPNIQADTGRTALHGAAHKGRPAVIQMLADAGADLEIRDYGNTDNRGGALAVHTWQAVDYADGLVRVGVQSAIGHPEAGLLLRKLMTQAGLATPPVGRTLESICITEACE
jgi:ankyrin repeat protein